MRCGDDLTIRVEFEALHALDDVVFSLEIRDKDGDSIMRTDTSIIGTQIAVPRGTSVMHFGIVGMPAPRRFVLLRPGDPEPERHPLRLAGERRVVRGDEPGKTTGMLRLNVHAALISSESDLDPSAAMAQPL